MSTTTTTPSFGFGASKIQARPKQAVTMTIKEVKAKAENPDSDYDIIEIITEPTRGSKKVFPTLMLRPEQLAGDFDPAVYTNYTANPGLAAVKPGKSYTIGETFALVYHMNIAPATSTPTRGKNAGVTKADRVTTLMAVAGGTLEGLKDIAAARDAAKADGSFDGSAASFAVLLNGYLKSRSSVPEIVAIIKQSKDESGNLSDRYEVDSWLGPLSDEIHEQVTKRVAKSAGAEVGRQLQLGYRG